ncbi:MAG: MmgE/PrpD family protein [Desulfurococcales archaeon]|nr:MmgE/PrpD family protein [Desulfurococcales archaeon]
MATIARRMAEWASSYSIKNAPENVVEELKKRFVDTMAVAVGAFKEKPVTIARKIALGTSGSRYSATVWGTLFSSAAQQAVFANGCAARYFDFNDTYLSKEALHPSDTIPAIVAAAEISESDGREVLEGMAVSYEIAGALADSYSVRGRGLDHVVYINIASAVGAAKVLGLDVDGIENAVNIAVTTSLALRQTRAGELSMWKGCAAAHAAANGFFSALLAYEGMTGPAPVFEGEFGFFNVALGGEKFELSELRGDRVLRTSIKYWPVEYHSMSAVEAALKIRREAGPLKPEDIKEVQIRTFTVSYKIIVKDPEKWRPKTRETADHSLPYIVAVALLDGKVDIDSFSETRIKSRDVAEVMEKTRIEVDPEYDKIYPEGIPNKIIVKTREGRTYEAESIYPPGHFRNPLARREVEEKLEKLVKDKVDSHKVGEFLKLSWNLEKVENVRRLVKLLALKS